jgi:hypothetical protein
MPLVAPFFNEALLRHSECTRHRRARPQRGRTNCPHMPSTRRLLYDTYIMQRRESPVLYRYQPSN